MVLRRFCLRYSIGRSTILDGFRGLFKVVLWFLGDWFVCFCKEILIFRDYLLKYLRIIGLHISKKSRTFALAKE